MWEYQKPHFLDFLSSATLPTKRDSLVSSQYLADCSSNLLAVSKKGQYHQNSLVPS